MRPQRQATRAIPVVDRSGQRVPRPRATDAPGVTPRWRMPVVNGTAQSKDQADEAKFRTLTRQQQIEAAITAHVDHVRRQNSPEAIEKLSETEFWRFVLDESLRNAQLLDTGSDLRIVLRAASRQELHSAWLACRNLAPKTTATVTRPRMPAASDPVWTFIKDLRVRTGE